MATITGLTKERMEEIEGQCIVSAAVVGDDLILYRNDSSEINLGSVKGPPGDPGSSGGSVPDHIFLDNMSGTYRLDAQEASDVTLRINGDLILLPPSNGSAGQRVIFEIIQKSPGGFEVSFGTSGEGNVFGWSSSIPSFSASGGSNSISYFGIRYSDIAGGWHVMAVSEGHGVF